jgi:MFS transporter, MHS family, proline/betaine transporter
MSAGYTSQQTYSGHQRTTQKQPSLAFTGDRRLPTKGTAVMEPVTQAPLNRNVLLATLIGNFTEWFDFAVYGAVAVTLGKVFFPSHDPVVSLLSSLGVFGIAFLFRPLGGAVLGSIGDRFVRRVALSAAIVGISAATTLIALLPSYAQIGFWAPLLLISLRCIQGVSAGGEWTTAGAFLAEYAPPARRGFWLSAISVSAGLALALGSVSVLLLQLTLTPEAMQTWGWRIPFLVAAPLGLVGVYLRLRLDETPVYRELRERHHVAKTPLRDAFRDHKREIGLAFVCASITGIGLYYFAVYFVNTLSTGSIGRTNALLISAIAMLVYVALCPLVGALSDRIGRRPIYIGGCVALVVLAWPIFALVSTGSALLALLGLLLFAVPQSALNSMVSVTLVELFPPQTRSSGASLAYGLGLGPIAGSAPLVATALLIRTGSYLAPAAYLVAFALVAAVVLFKFLPETRGRSLVSETSAVAAEQAHLVGSAA